jgi:glycosyltransferase involved in cell wall biosynthesis
MPKETKPLVSILMTAYNREDFISEAIESVLNSTYRNFELIIVDDCSKDKTVKIARMYESQDNRVHVYVNDKNLGDYPNRNKSASLAKGKYIKYVDADDYFYPWGLEILVQSMENYPDAGWGLCSLEQDRDKPFPFMLFSKDIFEYHLFKSSLFHKAPLSAIIKRDVFESVGGFSGKRQMSDTEMWHILAMKYPLVLMPQGIVWYREHNQQESAQIRTDLSVRIRYTVAKLHFFMQEKEIPISEAQKKTAIIILRKELIFSLFLNLLKLRFKDCFIIIKCWSDHSYDFKKSNTQ